jgi:DNA-binding MarR family transcriptional regulator
MSIQLSFAGMGSGLYTTENGEWAAAKDHTIITKFYLEMALKYRSDFEVADTLGITLNELDFLKTSFKIKLANNQRLSPSRLRIMDTVEKHIEKYGDFPTLSYLRRRTKLNRSDIEQELKVLDQNGFIRWSQNQHIAQAV